MVILSVLPPFCFFVRYLTMPEQACPRCKETLLFTESESPVSEQDLALWTTLQKQENVMHKPNVRGLNILLIATTLIILVYLFRFYHRNN